jgi:hypothetical protein
VIVANSIIRDQLPAPHVGLVVRSRDTGLEDRWDGAAWKPHVTGWMNATIGAGWSATTGFTPRFRLVGKRVDIAGAVTLGTGGSYGAVLTVPDGFRPAAATNLGAICPNSSNTFGMFQILTSGALAVVNATGATPLGMVLPVHGSWYID